MNGRHDSTAKLWWRGSFTEFVIARLATRHRVNAENALV
jgi:hypothetical protein